MVPLLPILQIPCPDVNRIVWLQKMGMLLINYYLFQFSVRMALVLSLKGTDYSLKGTLSVPFRDNTRAIRAKRHKKLLRS